MGCWFSRGTKLAEVEVVNNSQLSLHLWVNGGGPVCKCPPGKTTTASLPAHLSARQDGPRTWTATLDLPDARAGMQGLHVCSWHQVTPWLEFPVDPRTSLRLNVDLGVHNLVNNIDLGVHNLVNNSRLSDGHTYPLNIRTFTLLVQKQRDVKTRLRERRAHKAAVWQRTRVRAAKTLQRVVRSLLAKCMYECPICLDDLPWLETTRLCKSSRTGGGHRLCAPCATRYVDLAIGEGKLYVRCSGIGCGELVSKASLQKLASPSALEAYDANLVGVHTQRLADESDPTFLTFASEHTRRCPACQVLIWRSAGCDQMACRCGHDFNWSSPEARVNLV